MLLKVLLVLMLFVLFFPIIEYRSFSIDDYVDMLRPYSGLSPEHFVEFRENLQRFRMEIFSRPQLAKQYLVLSIESARDMALYTRTADSSVQYEVDEKINVIETDMKTILEKEIKKYKPM
jgi:hypothetical protein